MIISALLIIWVFLVFVSHVFCFFSRSPCHINVSVQASNSPPDFSEFTGPFQLIMWKKMMHVLHTSKYCWCIKVRSHCLENLCRCNPVISVGIYEMWNFICICLVVFDQQKVASYFTILLTMDLFFGPLETLPKSH